MKFNMRNEEQSTQSYENKKIDITNQEDSLKSEDVAAVMEEETAQVDNKLIQQEDLVEAKEETEMETEEELLPPPPVDAKISITISGDKMRAYIEITPPENGGEEVSVPMIISALNESKIKVGIKKDLIFKMPLEKAYDERKVIAEGTPAINGIKGEINHLFDLAHRGHPKVSQDGCADFKDMGFITNILKDNIICEIVKPIEPVSGVNIFNEPVEGNKAPELKIPRGNNTYISEDGLSLCAQTKGNLRLDKGFYAIDEVIIIRGDVDIATGDIDFVGKVEVKGNILEGYSVKCIGDIIVSGMVEGAIIETKGNAEIRGGISGMDCARIQCKGDLKTRFIENATAIVNGNIDTDYILNSYVSCNGKLKAMGKKGVIIGGNCTALQLIETRSIGNNNGSKTDVTVGITTEIIDKRKHLTKELENCNQEQIKYSKDLQYLIFQAQMGDLSQDRRAILKAIKVKLPLLSTKKKMLIAQQEKIQEILNEGQKSKIVCHGDVYPGVVVSIASTSISISNTTPRGSFILIDGEIKIIQ